MCLYILLSESYIRCCTSFAHKSFGRADLHKEMASSHVTIDAGKWKTCCQNNWHEYIQQTLRIARHRLRHVIMYVSTIIVSRGERAIHDVTMVAGQSGTFFVRFRPSCGSTQTEKNPVRRASLYSDELSDVWCVRGRRRGLYGANRKWKSNQRHWGHLRCSVFANRLNWVAR